MHDKYGNVWDKWDKVDMSRQLESHKKSRKKYLGLIKKYLKGRGRPKALEVGCGSSIDAHLVAEETKAEVYGIDISEKALKVARDVSHNFDKKVRLSVGDARKTEFTNDTFDLVFSQGLIEHFEKPLEILKEQVRILKTGGILIVNVPQKYTAYTLYKHLLASMGKWEWGRETEFSGWQLKQFGDYLGLEFIEKCGYDYWRSPFELTFVLKTLDGKIAKIPFVKRCPVYVQVSRFWKRMWEKIENRYGHLFMKNIVFVYKKS